MSQLDPNRRFQAALDQSHADWRAADPARAAALAGCPLTPDGIIVRYFGAPYRVDHPDGELLLQPDGRPVHPTITIVLLHHLLKADGIGPADRWIAFRELPDGLFYAQAFAGHAEGLLAGRFGSDVEGLRRAARLLGGTPLDALGTADASYRFQALPRLAIAVLLWAGDDEFPAQARVLFDAHAGHYLPTENLAGLGDWLAHRLVRLAAGQASHDPAGEAGAH